MKCLSHSLMSAYVFELEFALGQRLSKLRVCSATPNTSQSFFFFIVQTPTNSWSKITVYYMRIIVQIYSHAENTSQISCCSNQVQKSFPQHLLTQNNIPILSDPLEVTSHQPQNPPQGLTTRFAGSHMVFSTSKLFSEKTRKIWFFTLIQTTVKRIISPMISKVSQLCHRRKWINTWLYCP